MGTVGVTLWAGPTHTGRSRFTFSPGTPQDVSMWDPPVLRGGSMRAGGSLSSVPKRGTKGSCVKALQSSGHYSAMDKLVIFN